MKIPKPQQPKFLELIRKFSKIAKCKVKIQKLIAFIHNSKSNKLKFKLIANRLTKIYTETIWEILGTSDKINQSRSK